MELTLTQRPSTIQKPPRQRVDLNTHYSLISLAPELSQSDYEDND